MGRREELLSAVREHTLPIGPLGDLDERDRLEQEWENTLTEDDCLELLGWLRDSHQPSTKDYWPQRWAWQITSYVARTGRRCRGARLLSLLLDLLCDPQRSDLAFDTVYELEESAAYDNLLVGAVAQEVPINSELAWVATPAQSEQLRRVACSPHQPQNVRTAVRDILRGITLVRGAPSPFVTFSPNWRTDTARAIARQMVESQDFSTMPILADALQDAGCEDEQILLHCRGSGPHVRGCWVVDHLLGNHGPAGESNRDSTEDVS